MRVIEKKIIGEKARQKHRAPLQQQNAVLRGRFGAGDVHETVVGGHFVEAPPSCARVKKPETLVVVEVKIIRPFNMQKIY